MQIQVLCKRNNIEEHLVFLSKYQHEHATERNKQVPVRMTPAVQALPAGMIRPEDFEQCAARELAEWMIWQDGCAEIYLASSAMETCVLNTTIKPTHGRIRCLGLATCQALEALNAGAPSQSLMIQAVSRNKRRVLPLRFS